MAAYTYTLPTDPADRERHTTATGWITTLDALWDEVSGSWWATEYCQADDLRELEGVLHHLEEAVNHLNTWRG